MSALRLLALSAWSAGFIGFVGLVGLVAPTAACSKFGESSDGTVVDAGEPPDGAPVVDSGTVTGPRRIYVFGGVTFSPAPVSVSAQYATVGADGELGAWTHVPSLDVDRFAGAWAQAGDKVFAFGGIVIQQKADTHQSGVRGTFPVDPTSPSAFWTNTTLMPTARNYAASLTRGTSVYVSGGRNDVGAIGNVERYNSDDTWTSVGPMMTPVAGHAVLLRNDQMYVIGGDRRGAAGPTSAVTKSGFDANGGMAGFADAGQLSAILAYHSIALVEPWLFVIGGTSLSGTIPGVMRGTFDDATGALSTTVIAPLPAPASQTGLTSACTVVIDRTIYVIGGVDVEGKPSKGEVYIGRVDGKGVVDWKTSASALPVGRAAFGCAVSP